uniref:Lipoprotein n=1 Tax=uncultured bacterium contig00043 TaxID=1181530 RepID=A0A806KPJ4_9BACT|nr:FIG01187702: hypothetical protein [uncultured bacterium contig00043]
MVDVPLDFTYIRRKTNMFRKNFIKLFAVFLFIAVSLTPAAAQQMLVFSGTDTQTAESVGAPGQTISMQSTSGSPAEIKSVYSIFKNGPLFPSMLFTETIFDLRRAESSLPYWVNTKEEFNRAKQYAAGQISILMNNDILAFYGHPHSPNMGILGRYNLTELDAKMSEVAAEYEAVSGGRKIMKAFYLIYGTVWPEGEIGFLNHNSVMRYINYGLENDMLVILDHQIGRFDPIDSLKKMLPYLRYPNVHLALDPEWRTAKPMVDFGFVTGDEINKAQQIMENYLIENDIPGERMLLFHQFNYMMIKNRGVIKSDFSRVRLIHCMDGIGDPEMKRSSYEYNAQADNIPVKGFKLFYNFKIPGAGFDNPIMTPKEVYELEPRPYVIMYQ